MSSKECGLAAIKIAGTPYETGFALGQFGASAVHDRLVPSPHWREIVVPARDDPRVPAMVALTERHYPAVLEELRGLADGLDMPFADIFAWNCRGDLRTHAPDGCTTVQLPGSTNLVAHNEDGMPEFDGNCALATVHAAVGPSFTAFVYPGSIPGHTFSVNGRGLVQTVNNIRCTAHRPGLPRMVLTRAMLGCESIDAAVSVLQDVPRAGGFHVTLAMMGDPRIVSVEFNADVLSTLEIEAPATHANHLVHPRMAGLDQRITASSGSRQQHADALLSAGGAQGSALVLGILSDQTGALPIYRRQADDPDHENTLATAVFELTADRVAWTVYDGRHRAPVHSGVITGAD
ncbi:MAG: C45 family peptidase [Aquamicrobium sp.]|nr:C45 family peptidase [Aquamicrobium sp.]